jgi:hypothetical protein
MNPTKIIFAQENIVPKHWFVSLPHLYGGAALWDIVGGKKAIFPGADTQKALWTSFGSKPGAWSGGLSTVGRVVPSSVDINVVMPESYTMSFWFKPAAGWGTNHFIFNSSGIDIKTSTSNRLVLITTGASNAATASNILVSDTWMNICITCRLVAGENILLYVNGKLAATQTNVSLTSSQTLSAFLNLGNTVGSSSNQVYGEIDDIMIFPHILGPEAVYKVYKNTFIRTKMVYDIWSSGTAIGYKLFNMLYGGQL